MNAVWESVAMGALILAATVAIFAGVLKLRFRREFASAVVSWNLGAPRFSSAVISGLPWIEVTAGLLALAAIPLRVLSPAAPALLSLLFFALAAGQVAVLRRTTSATCGCFGRSASRVGPGTVSRSALLGCLPVLLILAR